MYADNFFLFASDKKNSVQSRIYGYAFQKDSVVNNVTLQSDISFENSITGAFVYVKGEGKTFQIFTDSVGFGLCFYIKIGSFWACSNSFYMLFEYVKNRSDLILNNNYLSLFYENSSISTLSFEQTYIEQIKFLHVEQKISVNNNNFSIETKYSRFSPMHRLDTDSSLSLVDRWANKWISCIRSFVDSNLPIRLQLSGGFDSRIVLALFLASGIDLNKIHIESSLNMKEDLEIAEEIGKIYNFNINIDPYKEKVKVTKRCAMHDINLYNRFGIHKEYFPIPHYTVYDEPIFVFTGYGAIRDWFNGDMKNYLTYMSEKSRYIALSDTYQGNMYSIINDGVKYIREVFGINPYEKNIMNFLLYVSRARFNHGTSAVASSYMNQILCAPIPELRSIHSSTKTHEDNNLLYAYIFARFAPELLGIRFSGGRSIDGKTVDIARRLNAQSAFVLDSSCSKMTVNAAITKYEDQGSLEDLSKSRLSYITENNRDFVDEQIIDDIKKKLQEGKRHCETWLNNMYYYVYMRNYVRNDFNFKFL